MHRANLLSQVTTTSTRAAIARGRRARARQGSTLSERTPERRVAAEIELAGEAAGEPHATPGVDGEGGELAAGRWPPYSADAIATVMAPEGA